MSPAAHPRPALRRGLYLVTRPEAVLDRWLARIEDALRGGAVQVQYRDKSNDAARRRAEALALSRLCRDHGVPLIVNDDVALAREVGAEGVHLGEADAPLAHARERLGAHALIGVSCYDDAQLATRAAAAGADYIAFGSFFASPTKPGARRAHPELLTRAAGLGLPRVAIGGLTPDNAAALVRAGADQLAVVSAIWDAADARTAARAFTELYTEADSP